MIMHGICILQLKPRDRDLAQPRRTWTTLACACPPLRGTAVSSHILDQHGATGPPAHLVVVNTRRPAVHLYERIANDKFDKWAGVQLSQDEAE